MGLPCEICDSNETDEGIFGEMATQAKHLIHRNCLILTMGKFVQDKHADYRILHYLRYDFLAEKSRYRLVRCSYCLNHGPNLSCSHPGCKCAFHTKCGVANLAVLQYGGKFDCFCAEHVPQPPKRPEPDDNCVLCLCLVVPEGEEFSPALAFQGPCCKSGWFHRDCVQDQSNATTHNFRCPLCRDERKFAEVAMFGVSVPKCIEYARQSLHHQRTLSVRQHFQIQYISSRPGGALTSDAGSNAQTTGDISSTGSTSIANQIYTYGFASQKTPYSLVSTNPSDADALHVKKSISLSIQEGKKHIKMAEKSLL